MKTQADRINHILASAIVMDANARRGDARAVDVCSREIFEHSALLQADIALQKMAEPVAEAHVLLW